MNDDGWQSQGVQVAVNAAKDAVKMASQTPKTELERMDEDLKASTDLYDNVVNFNNKFSKARNEVSKAKAAASKAEKDMSKAMAGGFSGVGERR